MHISTQINTFNYLGSKYSILPWLIPQLEVPGVRHFVEGFGGSMVVTINKKQVPIETYNDINHRIVNFFRVLRDRPEELITKLYLTPHSREEYEGAWDDDGPDELERARKFFVRVRQSFLSTGSQQEKKGWLSATKSTRCKISEAVNKFLQSVDGLDMIVQRLKVVQIECRSYDWLLNSYDTPETLFYLDPPYDNEKRNSSTYEYDFIRKDHYRMRDMVADVKGKVAVSCYDSDFIQELYAGLIKEGRFHFIKGPRRKNSMSDVQARECLITNYNPQTMHGGKLFH